MIYYSLEGRKLQNFDEFIANCLNELIPVHPEHDVDILIRMKKRVEDGTYFGICGGDREEITIEIAEFRNRRRISKQLQAATLAHELTHAKQFIFEEINGEDHVWRKNGHSVDCSDLDYDQQPWEIEAEQQEERLYDLFWKR